MNAHTPTGHDARRTTAIDRHVGARVRARRLQMGLSQEALGAMAGITFQQVQKYERGVNRLSAGRLVQFADALDADVTMFFDGLKAARAGIANTPFINADDMSAIRDLQALSPEGRKVARTTIRQLRSAFPAKGGAA